MVMLPTRSLAGLLLLWAVPDSAFVVVPGRAACGGSPGEAQATQALVSDATQHNNPNGSVITGRSGVPSLHASSSEANPTADASIEDDVDDDDDDDDDDDEDDTIINIKDKAMSRLRELKSKQDDPSAPMILRMGVRSGGCSGMSYVMDFTTEDDVNEDDEVDQYPEDGIKCVVDAKSLLFLYGLELDYSDELIGGGFKFFNPNAEEECGCGSSFGV